MKLNRKLNLIVPLDRGDDGPSPRVFATPIRRETFEEYHAVIARTFTRIYAEKLHIFGGPRVAALMLRETAKETPRAGGSWWEGPDGVENGLLREIRRLTNVLVPTEAGWQTIPYEDAVKREFLDEEEAAEVEGALAFFTVNSAMHTRALATQILQSAAEMWGWEVSSSALTEYRSGLPTSTPAETSTAKVSPSRIPA